MVLSTVERIFQARRGGALWQINCIVASFTVYAEKEKLSQLVASDFEPAIKIEVDNTKRFFLDSGYGSLIGSDRRNKPSNQFFVNADRICIFQDSFGRILDKNGKKINFAEFSAQVKQPFYPVFITINGYKLCPAHVEAVPQISKCLHNTVWKTPTTEPVDYGLPIPGLTS